MKISTFAFLTLICLSNRTVSYSQIISASDPISWLNSENFPNIAFEKLEDKKFRYKKNENPYARYITYALTSDTTAYQITIDHDSEQYDYELEKRIEFSKYLTFLFFGSQKQEYNLLAKQIKETCTLVVVRDDIMDAKRKHRIYKKNNVWIRVSDGNFASGLGMFYGVEFYKRK